MILYEKGMIYRGTYLINWSPGLKTAVSDLEVEYSEEEVTLYYFKYPLKGGDDYIPVLVAKSFVKLVSGASKVDYYS